MEEILNSCCGLDVHRDTITACVMIGNGPQKRKHFKTFSTFTRDIRELSAWLKELNIKQVAVESTGIYWKPIFNIFESDFEIILVNPQHIKNVPGRKTDVKDSEWLCKLLKAGLLNKSFIPPKDIRRLRELVRTRASMIRDSATIKNRLIKFLENANIKLSTVFSDVFGATSWSMICKLVEGETDLSVLTGYIHKKCKSSLEDIQKALEGTLEDEDRWLLKFLMDQVRSMEDNINEIEKKIMEHIKPYEAEVTLLKTIPGIKDISAASIIAEIGVDMNQFFNSDHLAAWAGMCPGSNQSAGKIKSSRIRKGNKHAKAVLIQVAWGISRTKNTYLGAKYRALALRRGKKRAIVAIGRKALVICYHVLHKRVSFSELGVNFLDGLEPERKARYHAKRLEELGYHVVMSQKIA